MSDDRSAIDKAVIVLLASDATLLANMTNGIYRDEAPPWATAFVILSVEQADEIGVFNKTGFVDRLYLIEPRARVGAGGDVDAAAARIHTLLHDQPLTVAGYTYMAMYMDAEATTAKTERDALDESFQFNKHGALYRVQMSL